MEICDCAENLITECICCRGASEAILIPTLPYPTSRSRLVGWELGAGFG